MNAMLKAQISDLESSISELERATREAIAKRASLEQEKDALQRDRWRLERERNTLQHLADGYDALQDTCARLRQREEQIQAGLRRILDRAKSLSLHLGQ